jgi:hypothetical protein
MHEELAVILQICAGTPNDALDGNMPNWSGDRTMGFSVAEIEIMQSVVDTIEQTR